jgi:hypothetical protein
MLGCTWEGDRSSRHAWQSEGVGGVEPLFVKGDEMELRDHGDGAIKHKKMTRIGGAEAERTIEGAEGGS